MSTPVEPASSKPVNIDTVIDTAEPALGVSAPRVLHLAAGLDETCPTYNEHCLPLAGQAKLGLCTYFAPEIEPSPALEVYPGDGTVAGFYRALREALDHGGYDTVHAHAPHFAPLLLPLQPFYRRALRRRVFTVHNSYQNFRSRNKLWLLAVFAYAGLTVSCSKSSAASFPAPYRLLAGRRFTYVQNGLDIARVDRTLAALGAPADDEGFTVLSVGRVIPIKNPLCLLHAFADVAGAGDRLRFIGAGDLQSELAAALGERQQRGLAGEIELAGTLPRDEVFRQFRGADLFVTTSYGEGLPIATLEAMACGCPVVLSDIPPHREIAEGCDFIPLVAPDDRAGFAREIDRFRRLGPAARAEIGRRCRRQVEQRFSLESMLQGYQRLYREL